MRLQQLNELNQEIDNHTEVFDPAAVPIAQSETPAD